MELDKKKKIIIAVLLVLVVAYFIVINMFGPKLQTNFILTDGFEWTDVDYQVTEGDAAEFSAELKGPQKLKITYNGPVECLVDITFSNDAGESKDYVLRIYEDWSATQERTEIFSELLPVDE